MLKGFKEFILRGNVIDLAVGIIIGAAFTAVVAALVADIFNPIIGALFDASDLKKAFVVTIPTISGGTAKILFGSMIAAVLQFLIIALVVFFAIVLPINHLGKLTFAKQRREEEATPVDLAPTETELLIQIRDLLASRPVELP